MAMMKMDLISKAIMKTGLTKKDMTKIVMIVMGMHENLYNNKSCFAIIFLILAMMKMSLSSFCMGCSN